jgi:rRNA maturation endonuclease Nob1
MTGKTQEIREAVMVGHTACGRIWLVDENKETCDQCGRELNDDGGCDWCGYSGATIKDVCPDHPDTYAHTDRRDR